MSPGLAVDDVMAATERAIGVVGLRARLPHHVIAAGRGDFTPGDDDRFDCFFGCHISGERWVLELELEPGDLAVAEFAGVAQTRDRALRCCCRGAGRKLRALQGAGVEREQIDEDVVVAGCGPGASTSQIVGADAHEPVRGRVDLDEDREATEFFLYWSAVRAILIARG